MVQVVIQPSISNPVALRHWRLTILQEVRFEALRDLTDSQHDALVRMHPGGSARFWGTHAKYDRRMDTLATGDVVLFTGKKHVQGIGEVGASFRNSKVADGLWTPDPDKGSYHNVYSLRSFELTKIPYEEICALPGFNAQDNFMSTRFVDDGRAQTLLDGLGITTTTALERDNRQEQDLARALTSAAGPMVVAGEAMNVTTTSYDTPARTTLVHRAESLLVKAYVDHLGLPHERTITPAGLTDLYLPADTGYELIEAKSSTSRGHVREAIGQLLDYAPHCPDATALAILLLPERPDQALVDYAHRYGINVIHRRDTGGFERADAPTHTRAAVLGLAHGTATLSSASPRASGAVRASYPNAPTAAPGTAAAPRRTTRTDHTATRDVSR